MNNNQWKIWFQFMRLDRPIGFFLLLWPTLWSLWLANLSIPSGRVLIFFIVGTLIMRSAGCIINDYIDQNIDSYVTRTRLRPLPMKKIKKKEAMFVFFILILFSFFIVLKFNIQTVILSIITLLLICIYPFMKRYIHCPQVILGITFSCAILIVFSAINNFLSINCWILFLANFFWTIAYDTQYAMIDKNDDLHINIYSSAIFFGNHSILIIGCLQFIMLILFGILGWNMNLHRIYYLALVGIIILFIYQYQLMITQKKENYQKAFLSNNFIGMIIFLGIFTSLLIS